MNKEELLSFNKRLYKLKKICINLFICSGACLLGAFGCVFKMNPVKTDLKEFFSNTKSVIFIIIILVVGIIFLILYLIYKFKLKECLSYIDYEKYEECDKCKSIKLKSEECTFPHNDKDNMFLPATIFMILLMCFMILFFIFF